MGLVTQIATALFKRLMAVRLLPLCFDRSVTVGTVFHASFEQQRLQLTSVGVMTGRTVSSNKGTVDTRQSHFIQHLLMTVTTNLALHCHQNASMETLVLKMTAETIAIARRLMVHRLCGSVIGMTIEPQLIA